MPTILKKLGFRFFFYSNEGNEPPHVHVEKAEAEGKYWLKPVEKVYTKNFSPKDEKQANRIVREEQSNFIKKWYEYFS